MSDDRWMYRLYGTEFGPVPFESLADLAANGHIGPDDTVCGPAGRWQRAGDIVGLCPEPSEQPANIELPSIASEDSLARVITPADQASLPTLGPSRDQTIGPRSLTTPQKPNAPQKPNPRRPAAPKPESMRDVLANMLENAESAPNKSSAAAGEAAKPEHDDQEPATTAPKAVPAPSVTQTPLASAPQPEPTADTTPAEPTPPPTQQSVQPSAQIASAPRPAPMPRPSSKRGFDIDPEVVKKIFAGVTAVAVLAAIVVFGRPLLARSGSTSNEIEVQWKQTNDLVSSLLQMAGSGDPERLQKFAETAGDRSQAIIDEIRKIRSAGNDIDPMLSDEILRIHESLIPPILSDGGLTPDNVQRLTEGYRSARTTAEG